MGKKNNKKSYNREKEGSLFAVRMRRIISEFRRKLLEEREMWKGIEQQVVQERTLQLIWNRREGQTILP